MFAYMSKSSDISVGQCADSDDDFVDSDGFDCIVYNDFPDYCGTKDDEDFNGGEMCCVCGGGTLIPTGSRYIKTK